MKHKTKKIKASDFDAKFESGEDITEHLDIAKAVKRINIDFPAWSIVELDKEANRLGVARQALIKMWVIQRLDNLKQDKQLRGTK